MILIHAVNKTIGTTGRHMNNIVEELKEIIADTERPVEQEFLKRLLAYVEDLESRQK